MFSAAERDRDNFIYWTDDLQRIIKSHQTKLPIFEKVLEWLDIQPGMTIADVGAGTGQQSFRMAQKLQGTGRVFATDMNPRFVEYISEEARRRGLSNLEAVLVKGNQVKTNEMDEFYGRQHFDLILCYDVIFYIIQRVDFLRRLGRCLAPQGRLVVMLTEPPLLQFFREDFTDWEGFLADIRREPPAAPFGLSLLRPLQALLDADPPTDAGLLERAVLFRLNRLLEIPYFMQYVDGIDLRPGLPLLPEERPYAEWLLSRVSLAGLPSERTFTAMPVREFHTMQRLNKLLLITRFRPHLSREGRCPYESNGPESRWHQDTNMIRRELRSAGLTRQHEIPPYQAIWVRTGEGSAAA